MISLVLSISNGIAKELLKAMRKEKKKHNRVVLVESSKLNSIDNIISKPN